MMVYVRNDVKPSIIEFSKVNRSFSISGHLSQVRQSSLRIVMLPRFIPVIQSLKSFNAF